LVILFTSTPQKLAVQTFCVFVGQPQPWIRSAERKAPITAVGLSVPNPITRPAIPEPRPKRLRGPRYSERGARIAKKMIKNNLFVGTTARRKGLKISLTMGLITALSKIPRQINRISAGAAAVNAS
jgi:hypothetical protein